MSGHSKWSTIKHKKGLADAKRGKIFSKLSREIAVAARAGSNPENNPSLRFVIDKARSFNMPNENIERAIAKGSGINQEKLEESLIEAYGPGGIALLIKTITNNKNRTLTEIRSLIEKYGGKIAQEGSVIWLFDLVGKIVLSSNKNENRDDDELFIIELGALDVTWEEHDGKNKIFVLTKPDELEKIRIKLAQKFTTINSAQLTFIPKTKLPPKEKEKLHTLIEALYEHDDVQEVFNNSKEH